MEVLAFTTRFWGHHFTIVTINYLNLLQELVAESVNFRLWIKEFIRPEKSKIMLGHSDKDD